MRVIKAEIRWRFVAGKRKRRELYSDAKYYSTRNIWPFCGITSVVSSFLLPRFPIGFVGIRPEVRWRFVTGKRKEGNPPDAKYCTGSIWTFCGKTSVVSSFLLPRFFIGFVGISLELPNPNGTSVISVLIKNAVNGEGNKGSQAIRLSNILSK